MDAMVKKKVIPVYNRVNNKSNTKQVLLKPLTKIRKKFYVYSLF